ncbi:conserved hypothetical protein [Bradyrhizobium sp. ORS 278]|uniref:trypsin-like serine protease n=1 Tax=Bradyrhizobium sp. (strain ORS 278) TaxID=114615 RepID=UPI0001508C43|nr:trypsin-like serine protease [Bradyrhizobium sp. ORS 278]CAL77009.1 conserved hypothetical protein [Bradyrhizobium sp. ORS 278]
MPGDIETCLTEVRCKTTSGYGSGYLIAPDLVLTACHVIADLTRSPPDDLDIDIRTIAHFNARLPFQKAKLIWPPPARWQELADLDIALLEITPDPVTKKAAQPIHFGTDGLPRDKMLQISFAGFPRLMTIRNSDNRDVRQLFGEAAPATGVKQNIYTIDINKGRPAKSDEEWKGASGAAVFSQGQLIAVLTVKIVDGMDDFSAMRLDAALRDPDFRQRVAASQAAISTKGAAESNLNLGRLVCLVDRDPQDSAFRTAYRKLLDDRRVRPLCCLIYGGARHRPIDLADRFALVTIPELRKLRPGETSPFKPINWPSSEVDVTNGLATLRALLWNVLCDEDGSEVPVEPAAFRERLCDESRPHFFVSELSPTQLTAESAVLWSAWLAFLESVAVYELSRPPLHIFLVTDATRAQIEAWLKQITPAKEVALPSFAELGACKWIDFGEWIDRRVPKIVPALAAEATQIKDDLESELDQMLGGPREFTASDLKTVVRKVRRMAR